MKTVSLLVVSSLIAFTMQAQKKTSDTIPYIPQYHQKRLVIFSHEPVEKNKIIFLGNSIIEFGDWKKFLNDSAVINRGIAGDITFGVLNRLDDVIARRPSRVFILIGINDIAKNNPEKVIVRNIITIAKKIRSGSPSTQVFIHSILPTNDAVKVEYPDAFHKNDHVVKVNRQLKRKAKRNGYAFVDIYKLLSDKNGNLDPKYARSDGLHLNAFGYQLWVELLKSANYL
jgi:lysophospholipase L1-like esterase